MEWFLINKSKVWFLYRHSYLRSMRLQCTVHPNSVLNSSP